MRWTLVLIAALAAAPAAAELYKWVDADGNIHYSDKPPPATAKKAERKKITDKPSAPTVSYALQQAMKNFPVTLYSYGCGDGCNRAAALLAKRGVPHATRDPMDLQVREEMKKATGGEEVAPVLVVGRRALKGYDEAAWNGALDNAGYPSTAVGPVPVVDAPKPAAGNAPTTPAPAASPSAAN